MASADTALTPKSAHIASQEAEIESLRCALQQACCHRYCAAACVLPLWQTHGRHEAELRTLARRMEDVAAENGRLTAQVARLQHLLQQFVPAASSASVHVEGTPIAPATVPRDNFPPFPVFTPPHAPDADAGMGEHALAIRSTLHTAPVAACSWLFFQQSKRAMAWKQAASWTARRRM